MVAIGLGLGVASFQLSWSLVFLGLALVLAKGFSGRQWLVVGGLLGVVLAPKSQELPIGKFGTITGIVASQPVSRQGNYALRLSTSFGEISVYGLDKHFDPGERIEVKGVLRQSQGGNASWAIAARMEAVKSQSLGISAFWSSAASVRESLESYLRPRPEADWIEGLVLSPDPDFDQQSRKEALELGAGSLLAASGLHLAVFGFLLLMALQACGLPKTLQIGLLVVGFVFYGALCGFAGAMLRAGVILTLYEVAPLVRRNPDILSAVGLAAIVSLGLNPYEVFEFSFLAAMVAYMAIAIMPRPRIERGFLSGTKSIFARVLWICAALLPLQWYWFGTAPLFSILTGPFLLLCYPFVMAFALFGWMLSLVSAGAASRWMEWVLEPAARGLHRLVDELYSLPAIRVQDLPTFSWVLVVLVYFLAAWPWRRVAVPA